MRNALTIILVSAAFVVSFGITNCLGEVRTWTDKSGKYTLEAEFVSAKSGSVTLKATNGKTVTLEISKLSAKDQKFVRRLIEKMRLAKRKTTKPDQADSIEGSEDKTTLISTTVDSKDWFQWRGPNRDGISRETNLLDSWKGDGPELLWTADNLGNGMASVAVADGKIFTIGNRRGGEHMIALDQKDGSEIWATKIGSGGETNSTPTVDGDLVYGLGRAGDLACLNTKTGKIVWKKNFRDDFGGKMMSSWGYSESPLVDGDNLICTPGSQSAMIAALNKKTGETVWKTPMRYGGSRGTDGAGYASIVVSNGGGIKQYITLVGRGIISVNAKNGAPLWQYERVANGTANVPTPIVSGDYVFCSSGYNDGGSALLKINGRNGRASIQEIYYKKSGELQNHHGGMIKIGDYIYMGHGHNKGFPMCIEMKTVRKMWDLTRGPGDGSAAIVAADGHLYFRYESGVMALIEANPKEYKLKGTFKIKTRHKQSWPHPVINDGKLYLRDVHQLHCYDISKKQ